MTVALGINQLQNADNTVFLVPKWNGKDRLGTVSGIFIEFAVDAIWNFGCDVISVFDIDCLAGRGNVPGNGIVINFHR